MGIALQIVPEPGLARPRLQQPYSAVSWRIDACRQDDLECTVGRGQRTHGMPQSQSLSQQAFRGVRRAVELVLDMDVVHERFITSAIREVLALAGGSGLELGCQEPTSVLLHNARLHQ